MQAAESVRAQNMSSLDEYFDKNTAEKSESDGVGGEKLTPKTVTLHFPKMTERGGDIHEVHVPLITLVPPTQVELSKMKVEMDVAIIEDGDDIMVEFPRSKSGFWGRKKQTAQSFNTRIMITISTNPLSGGLESIVECYNKAVKNQMPF